MARRRWPGSSDFWTIIFETSTMEWIGSHEYAWKFGQDSTGRKSVMRNVGRSRRYGQFRCISAPLPGASTQNR